MTMPRTYETPGKDRLVKKIEILREPEQIDSYEALKKNGFSIPARDIHLLGELSESFEGDLLVEHRAAEVVISPADRVRNCKGGKFNIKAKLMRGRNTFFLSTPKNPDEIFRLDVFYRSAVREWVESILKALVLVLVVKTFVVQAFFIPTQSMESTLLVGDYLLVDKITYLFRDPRPGEIVVFEYPVEPSKDFIKRCVAVGGQVISHQDDRLTVDGKRLREPYTQYVNVPGMYTNDKRSFSDYKVPDGCFWMMGDNRNNSADCRYWGALPRWRIIGKAWAGYFPFNRMGLMKHEMGKPE